MEGLIDDVDSQISDLAPVEMRRTEMNNRIDYVMSIRDEITGLLSSANDYSVDVRDQIRATSRELADPLTWSAGTVSGQGEELVVNESPSINVNQMVAQNNEAELEDYMQNIEMQLHYYEEAIAGAMLNLMELERMIDGSGQLSAVFLDAASPLMGAGFQNQIESSFQINNSFQPVVQDGMDMLSPRGPSHMPEEQIVAGSLGSQQTLFQSSYSLHYLSEKYTEAAEAVRDFYSYYIIWCHLLRHAYMLESDDDRAEAARLLVLDAEDKFNEVFPPLAQMHTAFTQSLDILYTIKAEITATLYGMIEEYSVLRAQLERKEPAVVIQQLEVNQPGTLTAAPEPPGGFGRVQPGQDDNVSEMAALRERIREMLEPPVITSLSFSPGDPWIRGRNWADITWQAHHPGDVAETSYLIMPAGTGEGEFTSAGKLSSLRHYTWNTRYITEDADVPANSYYLSVRSRGSGGNTAIRSANVDLRIGSGGTSSRGEQVTGDVPPPSTPVIELPSYRSVLTTTHETYQSGGGFTTYNGFGSSGSSGSMVGMNTENIYYTNERTRLHLAISAHDEQTDIQKFEYALGTWEGQTDIVDWQQAVGVTSNTGAGGSGVTRRMETTLYGLNLEHGARYYLSARVTNSAGKTSSFSMSDPVVYDATPPTAPGFVTILGGVVGTGAIQFGSSPTPQVYPVVTKIPPFLPGRVNYPSNYAGEPSITRSWESAEDDLSGIRGYEYILTPFDDATNAFTLEEVQFTAGLTATVTGGMVTWTDPLYLHIRSKNYAGSVSEAITYGPFMPPDPSAPTPPVINAMVQSTGVRLCMPLMSGDYESQVAGYQYSMGTSPGATDIRGWGSGLDFDHGWTTTYPQQVSPNPPKVPVFNIPQENLPSGSNHNIYVNVRAVNGQQKISPVVSSGPFSWNTVPEEPLVTHNYDGKTGMLEIHIENIADFGAPISDVSYRVTDIESGKTLQGWTSIGNYSGGKSPGTTGSVSTATQVEGVGKSGLAVDVQATSTTGASTTTTVQNTTTTTLQNSTFNSTGMSFNF